MSRFEKFFETISGRFPSDTARYFAKPLLNEAYKQGYADRKAESRKGKDVVTEQPVIIASGRTGASDAEG